MRSLWAWLLDALLCVRCQMPGCRQRVRVDLFAAHMWTHAGEVQ